MLTPQTLQKLPDELVDLVNELQTDIIRSLSKKLVKTNYLTPSAEWQLYKAGQLRLSTNEVNKLISKYAGKSKRQIAQLYTDACRKAINNDAKIYRAYGKDCSAALRSVALSNTLKAGIKNANGMTSNLCKSMVESSRATVTHLMDKAWLKVQSGAFSYQEAIYDAVLELASQGISAVTYPSGHTDWADVAVRRAVMTGISQTAGQMQLDLAAEMDCDLVEVTAHMGARPSHALWQGKVYSISGKSKKYPKLSEATGYGTGAGLKGWNCRHDFYPFFEGVSERANLPVDIAENNEQYEFSQKQRAMERSIRKSKRSLAALDGALQECSDDELRRRLQNKFERTSETLKLKEKRLNEFCNANGLYKQNDRVRVVGFGRSLSQKAVHGSNRSFVNRLKSYGIENPPKSIDKFREMEYTNPPEYKLMNAYIQSVKSGYMSPQVKYSLYKDTYNLIQREIVGVKTVNGIEIKGQSKHFLERFFGTMANPSDKYHKPRSGISFVDMKEALTKGDYLSPKYNKNKLNEQLYNTDGTKMRSQKFYTDKCDVTINPDTGILIQCNPDKGG
ncbi:phage minor capsid protein [Ruminococcus sp. Marseille-P6503]|uniref:phage minor capsid protein n=1 Tax=Ruminococcus sp. Marseille-P6503 TaxID=2364796 RepID=UPI000F54A2BA|nr:phage minor capsid protein [Ruminococcus sp. Marseille-P6503]